VGAGKKGVGQQGPDKTSLTNTGEKNESRIPTRRGERSGGGGEGIKSSCYGAVDSNRAGFGAGPDGNANRNDGVQSTIERSPRAKQKREKVPKKINLEYVLRWGGGAAGGGKDAASRKKFSGSGLKKPKAKLSNHQTCETETKREGRGRRWRGGHNMGVKAPSYARPKQDSWGR